MVKRAILIGSTYHGNGKKSELEGVFTDIITRRNNLIDSFGYKSENIIMLTDKYMLYPDLFEDYTQDYKTIMIQGSKVMYSSKTNIKYIISKMIEESREDDELFVQFAGHGIQKSQNVWNKKESDNKDEVYLALNNRGELENLTDNELFTLFNPTPCKTIVIFDNCHSATIMDAPDVISYDMQNNKLVMRNENNNNSFNKNIIIISGARDKDWSYDGTDYISLQRNGIFTQSLIESQRKILESKKEIRAGKLLGESTKWLYAYHNNTSLQLPHISGNFESIKDVEEYIIYSKKCENITEREVVVNNKSDTIESDTIESDTNKILIDIMKNLLKKYF